MDKDRIAGVVLAGGRSSRMGSNKAFLEYNGAPLIDHMINLLHECGLKNTYVSGDLDGYKCIKDSHNFEGPACAIIDVFVELEGYDGALFIPVDMPLLSPEMLGVLLQNPKGSYFKKWPLPAFIPNITDAENIYSVKKLLDDQNIKPIDIPQQYIQKMKNFNTKEDWAEVVSL